MIILKKVDKRYLYHHDIVRNNSKSKVYMEILTNSRLRLSVLLWLLGIHSFVVGVGMILLPVSQMPFFGLAVVTEKFFPVQAGVFHFVLALAYILAAKTLDRFHGLVILTILAKFIATFFLFTYYFFIKQAWIILLSGVGDFLMGTLVLLAFGTYKKNAELPRQ